MSQPHKICPRCQRPAELQAPQCAGCGRAYRTQFPQNPDRTTLGASEPPVPSYPERLPPPSYPQQAYPYQPEPIRPHPQGNNQEVHVHLSAPQQPVLMTVASETQNDTCATLSVVFGVLGLLFFCLWGWVFGIVGLTLGIVSLVRLRRNPRLDGMPVAVAGIALSSIPVLFGIWLLWAAMAPAPAHKPSTGATPPAPTSAPVSVSSTRCALCEGTGRAPHFAHTGDGKSMNQYWVDGYITCPQCNGSGTAGR